jgi:hypothetical protein
MFASLCPILQMAQYAGSTLCCAARCGGMLRRSGLEWAPTRGYELSPRTLTSQCHLALYQEDAGCGATVRIGRYLRFRDHASGARPQVAQ